MLTKALLFSALGRYICASSPIEYSPLSDENCKLVAPSPVPSVDLPAQPGQSISNIFELQWLDFFEHPLIKYLPQSGYFISISV